MGGDDDAGAVDKPEAHSMAEMAENIQQYLIQESQTPYSHLRSFNGCRDFNLRIMSKLKIQAELGRAKRQQKSVEKAHRLKFNKRAQEDGGKNAQKASPFNSYRERIRKSKDSPTGKELLTQRDQRIVVLGVKRGSHG